MDIMFVNFILQAATTTIECRRNTSTRATDMDEMDSRVVELLQLTGFYGLARIGFFQLDHHLITALVERWRPETHTFHLPEGECTVTLQDVAIQTGLRIDGMPVIGHVGRNWSQMCQELLGRTPPEGTLKGALLRVRWLINEFAMPTQDSDEQYILEYTRAYLLRLIGGNIFCTKDSGRVSLHILPYLNDLTETAQYSWGSACLAYLYRELCLACRYPLAAQISGPLFLLQVWAWDRFPFLAPAIPNVSVPYDAPLAGRYVSYMLLFLFYYYHFVTHSIVYRWQQNRNYTLVPTHTLVHIRRALDTARQDDVRTISLHICNLQRSFMTDISTVHLYFADLLEAVHEQYHRKPPSVLLKWPTHMDGVGAAYMHSHC